MRKIFIAQDRRTGFHVVIEVLPSSYKFEYESGLDFDLFNKLCQWKNLNDLFSLLEKTGPLVDVSIYEKEKRIIDINDAVDMFKGTGFFSSMIYKENDLDFLRTQLYLDNKEGFYPSRRSISKAVESFGLLESDGIKELEEWARKDVGCKVAIEPLCDFAVIRNFCSVILRLIANYRNQTVEHPVEESGFIYIDRIDKWWSDKRLRDSYYVIPIWHNTGIDKTITFSTKWFQNVNASEMIQPLLGVILKTATEKEKGGLGSIKCADVLSAADVKGIGYPIFRKKTDYKVLESRGYLGLRGDIDQHKLIKVFLEEFGDMFRNLRADSREGSNSTGNLLSWEEKTPEPDEDAPCKRSYKTLAGAMVGTLLYRTDTIPVTCRNCGKGMLIKNKRKRREFCSASCKSQYYVTESEVE